MPGMKRLDDYLSALPLPIKVTAMLLMALLFFYFDHYTGPSVPFTLFYLLALYATIKYLGVRAGYVMAVVLAIGKTHISHLLHPDNTDLLNLYRFFNNLTLYLLFCFLMNAQMVARRRAELALDDLSKLHQAIVQKTDSGIMVYHSSGACVMANQAAATILGGTPEQIGSSDFRKIPSWQSSGLLRIADQVLTTGESHHFESRMHTEYGKDIWCIATLGRIDRKNGALLLLVFNDITPFREVQVEMLQARAATAAALNRAGEAERRIISISEDTQHRIGQELHDDLGQHLTGLAFMGQVLGQKLRASGATEAATDAEKMTALLNEAVSKTRQLAQSLYPVELKNNGLHEMLVHLIGQTEHIYPVECELVYDESVEFDDPEVVINLYRICQEALNNAVKHSGCRKISATVLNTSVGRIVEIADNGHGLAEDGKLGLGMHTMQYRARLIGATLEIGKGSNGGTSITVTVPPEETQEVRYAA